MKSTSLSSGWGKTLRGLFLVLLTANFALAQNFVKNPDFEQPLSADNWTVVYTNGSSPGDFWIAGRTTMGHKDMSPGTWDGGTSANFVTNYWSKFGGTFAPNHTAGLMGAYFKQTVTGLTPGAQYNVNAWMVQFSKNPDYPARVHQYLEAIGGITFNIVKRTAFVSENAFNNAAGWQRYTISNVIASASGQIEVRLRWEMIQTIAQDWEYRNLYGFFDRVSLVPSGAANERPPYQITAFTRDNDDVTLEWKTLMNNKYRIQASQDIGNPASWVTLERELRVDPVIAATFTNFTFRTNVGSLFHYNPSAPAGTKSPIYLDSNAPVFFRIYSEPYAQ